MLAGPDRDVEHLAAMIGEETASAHYRRKNRHKGGLLIRIHLTMSNGRSRGCDGGHCSGRVYNTYRECYLSMIGDISRRCSTTGQLTIQGQANI
jgi:hypothetical protein